jgi:hypothetical protein
MAGDMKSVIGPIVHAFGQHAIRTTENHKFAIVDVFVALGISKNTDAAGKKLRRLLEADEEVRTPVSEHKFPGPGQRADTKVADEEGIYLILLHVKGSDVAKEFRQWTVKVLKERREEEADPELAIARGRVRAVKTWKSQGKNDAEIAHRIRTIMDRNMFTDALKNKGVSSPSEYASVTNAVNVNVLGGTARELRLAKGLSKRSPLRDALTPVELAGVNMCELMTIDDMDQKDDIDSMDIYAMTCRNAKLVGEMMKKKRQMMNRNQK